MKQIFLITISYWMTMSGVFAKADPMTITRLTTPITLDGIVDEQQWLDIAPLPLVMHTPTFEG